MHGIRAWQRYAIRRCWKRKERLTAQEMHDSMLMDVCTRHLVSTGLSKLQLDIGRRTKALADGLQLAAPYAMHWLLKTRHRLHTSNARNLSRQLGQENQSANFTRSSSHNKPAAAVTAVQHDCSRPALSMQSGSSQGNGSSTANASQRRKVRTSLNLLHGGLKNSKYNLMVVLLQARRPDFLAQM